MLAHNSDFYMQVARLHIECITEGFLPQLGDKFLCLLYQAIDQSPSSVLIIDEQDGNVLGFVAGASDIKLLYWQLLQRPIRLLGALLPSLLVPSRVKRIWEILRYSKETSVGAANTLPNFELLSIVVHRSQRGSGSAESLYRALLIHCRGQAVMEFKIVVGDDLVQAHRFYQRMGAIAKHRIEVHSGQGSTVYVQAILNENT